MNSEIIKLVTLQKYDKEIKDINEHISSSSAQLEEDRKRLDKANSQLQDKENELKNRKIESEKIDTDIASLENNYKEFSYQLMSIKDEKSYDAMKNQIEDTKEEISQKEAVGIDLLNTIEEITNTVNLYKEKIQNEADRIENKQKEIDVEIESRSSEINEKQQHRNEYAKQIDDKVLKQYQKLLSLPNGVALASLDGRSCTGCYSEITREDLETIKLQSRLVNCNVCGRILYLPELLGKEDDN